MALFIVGLNLQFFYEILLGLEIAAIQPLEYLAFTILWSSACLSIAKGDYRRIRPRFVALGAVIGVYLFFLLILGLVNSSTPFALSRDIFAYSYVSALFVGARKENWTWLSRTYVAHLAVASLATLLALIPLRATLTYDSIVWTPAYKSWSNAYSWQFGLLYSTISGTAVRILTVSSLSLYFILILLFQKRTPLIAFAVLIVVLAMLIWPLIAPKRFHVSSLLYIAAAIILIPVLLLALNSQAVDDIAEGARKLGGRFFAGGTVVTAIENDPRFSSEASQVFNLEDGSFAHLLFGHGLGAEIDVSTRVSPTGRSGNFHNGVAGIVFNGGFILGSLMLIWLGFLAWDLRWIRGHFAIICIAIVAIAVALSPFQSVLNTSPAWALILSCMGYLVSEQLKQHLAPQTNSN